jgi:hypothetical protein
LIFLALGDNDGAKSLGNLIRIAQAFHFRVLILYELPLPATPLEAATSCSSSYHNPDMLLASDRANTIDLLSML